MNLKLNAEELSILHFYIVHYAGQFTFTTETEARLTAAIIRDLVKRLSARTFSLSSNFNIKLSLAEVLALHILLPQAKVGNPHNEAVLYSIYSLIDKFQLSLKPLNI